MSEFPQSCILSFRKMIGILLFLLLTATVAFAAPALIGEGSLTLNQTATTESMTPFRWTLTLTEKVNQTTSEPPLRNPHVNFTYTAPPSQVESQDETTSESGPVVVPPLVDTQDLNVAQNQGSAYPYVDPVRNPLGYSAASGAMVQPELSPPGLAQQQQLQRLGFRAHETPKEWRDYRAHLAPQPHTPMHPPADSVQTTQYLNALRDLYLATLLAQNQVQPGLYEDHALPYYSRMYGALGALGGTSGYGQVQPVGHGGYSGSSGDIRYSSGCSVFSEKC